MKSNKKRFSEILYNEFDKNAKLRNVKIEQINEQLKNSEFYKQKLSTRKKRIVFFYKTKYLLKKRISSLYLDSANNYNKMIINNILSNKISNIKQKYTEMLFDIEINDLFVKYIPKKDIYYFLKYLVVVYDKFYIPYPNYLKDINVYNFMSKYLLNKQKNLDLIKEENKYTYIQKKINDFFHKNFQGETKIILKNLIDSDTEENYSKFKQIKSYRFNVEVENSQDSIDQLESLVVKIDKNLSIPKISKIYTIKHSSSYKNIETFLLKYSKLKKPIKVKWKELYEINSKKFERNKKRKGTEFQPVRKKVAIDKVVEIDKSNKKAKKRKTKAEIRQNLINKRKEINEIKHILLINDIGKNNKILDVVKRGFVFINENENKSINTNNKNILINSYAKNNIKLSEDKIEKNNNKEMKMKEKLAQLTKNKNYNSNNYYQGENYNIFKNRKYIFKNLIDSLNDYRFYNKIKNNSFQKQKFYENRVRPKLFNNNIDSLLNSPNMKSINSKDSKIKTKNLPSIGSITPKSNRFNSSIETFCKRVYKLNNNNIDEKIKNISLLLFTNRKNKNEYYIDRFLSDNENKNSKIFNNKMERLENSIYNYYKTNRKKKKIPLLDKLNYFKNINLTDTNNSKIQIKNKNQRNNIIFTRTDYNNIFFKNKIISYSDSNNKLNNNKLLMLTLNKNKYNNNKSLSGKKIFLKKYNKNS